MSDDIMDYLGGCEGKNMLIAVCIAAAVAIIIYIFYVRKSMPILSSGNVENLIPAQFNMAMYNRGLRGESYIPKSGGNFNPDKYGYGVSGLTEGFTMNDGRDVTSADLFMQVYSNIAPQKF